MQGYFNICKSIVYTTNRMKNQNYMIKTIGTKKEKHFTKFKVIYAKKKKNHLTNKNWKEITPAEFKPFEKPTANIIINGIK